MYMGDRGIDYSSDYSDYRGQCCNGVRREMSEKVEVYGREVEFKEKCENCRYGSSLGYSNKYQCRRKPPKSVEDGDYAHYPIVTNYYWCGEYSAVKSEIAEELNKVKPDLDFESLDKFQSDMCYDSFLYTGLIEAIKEDMRRNLP